MVAGVVVYRLSKSSCSACLNWLGRSDMMRMPGSGWRPGRRTDGWCAKTVPSGPPVSNRPPRANTL